MIQIWRAVAADFHDLDVDVTTEPTDSAKLLRTSSTDSVYGMWVCIGDFLSHLPDFRGAGLAYSNIFADHQYHEMPLSSTNWGESQA
jgi:hypothetical protein